MSEAEEKKNSGKSLFKNHANKGKDGNSVGKREKEKDHKVRVATEAYKSRN